MALSWQQGPLGSGPVGRFRTVEPLPRRLLFAEPLRRMRVRFPWPEVARIANLVSFEQIDVRLDGKKLALEPGQIVIPHGLDLGLDPDEILHRYTAPARA